METAFITLSSSVGVLALFGCIAFGCWLDYRKKRQERETAHQERMKALELGIPLPDGDLAWAAAERTRGLMAGLIGLFVPVLGALAAVIATAVLVGMGRHEDAQNIFPMGALGVPWYGKVLFVIWPVWGVVSVVTSVLAIAALRRRPAPAAVSGRPPATIPNRAAPEPVLASIAEGPPKP
jgi:hypothetical protein